MALDRSTGENAINVQRAWSDARLQGQKFVNGASALIQSNPAYLQVAEKDASGNASVGDVLLSDSANPLVHATSRLVSVVGLSRNHETLQPEHYFERFVGHLDERMEPAKEQLINFNVRKIAGGTAMM